MTKINDLLKFANIFHQEAEIALKKSAAPPETWSMPDDEEDNEQEDMPDDPSTGKYNKMVDLARKVKSPDLSSEILLIAELYKKALELNAGYSSVNSGVNNLINDLLAENDDEDDPEVEMVEDVLNDVVKDLRARAGGPGALAKEDSPAVKMQLRELKNAFNRKVIEEESSQDSPDMAGGGGALSDEDREGLTEQTEGDLTQFDEKAKSTFDMTGGVGLEARQQGAGSGVSFTRRKTPKDWVISFKNEKERYQDLLGTESNKLIASKVSRLVDVLAQLETNTASEIALSEALMEARAPSDIDQFGNRVPSKKKTEFGAPDPVKEKELASLREENAKLKKERTALKISIKNTELQKTQNAFEKELALAKDPKERFLLEQEIALRKLQQSSDVNIGPEAEARRRLIRSISKRKVETLDHRELWEVNMPSKEDLIKLMQAISTAAQSKVSREEYNKSEAKKIQQHFAPGEEGKRKRGKPVNFEGKVIALRQSTATQKSSLKIKLLKKLSKPDELAIFRNIHDQINAAVSAGNNAALDAAKKELKKAMGDWAENQPATQSFIENAKRFYGFLESCFTLVKSKVLESDVSDAMLPALDAISDQGNQLILEFNNVEGYLPMVKATSAIVADLDLATGRVVKKANDMSNSSKSNTRKKILAELEKNITKKADDQNNLAGPETTMDDFSHQVFLDIIRDFETNGFGE